MPSFRLSIYCKFFAFAFICFTTLFYKASAQDHNDFTYTLTHYTQDDGLPYHTITGFAEDSLGYKWITSGVGVARFDGYEFKQYTPIPGDSNSLSGYRINTVEKDASGALWMGGAHTNPSGLNRFDYRTEQFKRFQHDEANPNSLVHDAVAVIRGSQKTPDIIWIGSRTTNIIEGMAGYESAEGGVSKYNKKTDTFTNFRFDPADPSTLPYYASDIIEDQKGTVWLAGWGISELNQDTGEVQTYLPDPSVQLPQPGGRGGINFFFSAYEAPSHPNILWLGSENGMVRFDTISKTFKRIVLSPEAQPPQVGFSAISNVYEDSFGFFWIVTPSGVLLFEPEAEAYTFFGQVPLGQLSWDVFEDRYGTLWFWGGKSLLKMERRHNSFNFLTKKELGFDNPGSIYEDTEGILWIGPSGGPLRYNRKTGDKERFLSDPTNPQSIGGWNANDIIEDHKGTFWFANCPYGIYSMDPSARGIFKRYTVKDMFPNAEAMGCANPLVEDTMGNIWVSVFNLGVARLDVATGTFNTFSESSHGLASNGTIRVQQFSEQDSLIWVSTLGGISRINTNTNSVTNYTGPSLNKVGMLHKYDEDRLWVATYNHGLHLFNTRSNEIERTFTTEDGLPSNTIKSIYEDNSGLLWFSTSKGLARFDPKTFFITSYFPEQVDLHTNFSDHSHFQNEEGELFFGALQGVVYFHPQDVKTHPDAPNVLLTNLHINGEHIKKTNDHLKGKTLSFTEVLQVPYSENDIAIDYVGIHSVGTDQIRYRYRMEGLEEDWIDARTSRSAHYPRLPKGDYTFRVQAANIDGVWSETGATLDITIRPPWWQTVWAYVLYGFGVLGLGFGVNRIQRQRLIAKERQQAQIREAELKTEAAQALSREATALVREKESEARALQAENDRKQA